MKTELVRVDDLMFIGLSARTTNEGGVSQREIGALWEKFMSGSMMAQIPNRVSDEIYSLYTDYESDHTGAYTVILGCKVSSLDSVPTGFVGRVFPPMTFRRLVAKGAMPESVGRVWNWIWTTGIERSYRVDFDLYGAKSQMGEDAEVEIYLS